MPRAIIFANGELNSPFPTDIQMGDWIIAADGGAIHCQALNLIPQYLIGDFDSLTPQELTHFENLGSRLLHFPAHKDETDLELALIHAVHLGADHIVVYGALGARWDMTFANLMLLTHPALLTAHIRLVDGNQEISLLAGGSSLSIQGAPGDIISLIPLSINAEGITTQSLEYPLNKGNLIMGSPRGVSNVMVAVSCQITLASGLLAVTHIQLTR